MKIIERIRDHIQPVFDGTDNQSNVEMRLLLLFPWFIISTTFGFFGQILAPEGYCPIMSLSCVIAATAIFAKPMVRISMRKNKKSND